MTDEKKPLWRVINPSDEITFRASEEEAAFIADRLAPSLMFVESTETGKPPSIPDLLASYEALWKDADRIASYAEAYRSFTVGTVSERDLLERAMAVLPAEEAKALRLEWHDKRRTSLNDICRVVWDKAEKIAAYAPETA
jgi:hypothetical protein